MLFQSDDRDFFWITNPARVEIHMRKARLATVIDDADIQSTIASPFSRITTRNWRVSLKLGESERRPRYGFLAVARTISSVYCCPEPVYIRGIAVPCHKSSPRSYGANGHRSISYAADPFLGRITATRTCSRSHRVIRYCQTAISPTCSHSTMGSMGTTPASGSSGGAMQ